MAITEYFSEEEEKEFGNGTAFEVRDRIICFDRRLAHALNHTFNHLHFMTSLIECGGWGSQNTLEFLVSTHPALREHAQRLIAEVGKPDRNVREMDVLMAEIMARLAFETQQLVAATAILGGAVLSLGGDPENPKAQGEIDLAIEMEIAIARIPFIDYHSPVEQRPSIVKLEIL